MATNTNISLLLADCASSRLGLLRKIVSNGLLSDSSDTVEAALLDLAELLADVKDPHAMSRAAYGLGAPSAVVACMKKWLHNGDIQEWALWCIHRLASNNPDARPTITSCGGVEAIVCSMKLYPSVADIQRGGFLALATVISPPISSAGKTLGSRFMEEWNGVQLVFEAMEKWSDNSEMQEAAIRLLCALGFSPDTRLMLMDAGAVSRVDTALEKFHNNERVELQARPFMNMMMKTMLFSQKNKQNGAAGRRRSKRLSLKPKVGRAVSVEC